MRSKIHPVDVFKEACPASLGQTGNQGFCRGMNKLYCDPDFLGCREECFICLVADLFIWKRSCWLLAFGYWIYCPLMI